jgi:hypothetical protein
MRHLPVLSLYFTDIHLDKHAPGYGITIELVVPSVCEGASSKNQVISVAPVLLSLNVA